MSQNVVELSQVTKRFGAVKAVDAVSLAIAPGEFFSLLGPSGCGKTTTLRLIAGLEQPDAGDVRIEGSPMQGRPPWQRPVAMVFQNYALFPHLDVAGNVGFGLRERKRPPAEIAERVRKALALVRLDPAGYAARKPAELSGGQRQRVALARAIVLEPRILLLDEPLGALDLQLRKAMQLELKALNRQLGITFILVTHDQDEALAMSDRIALMDGGRVAQVGTPEEIYEHPRTAFVARFIGECNVLPGPAGGDIAVRPERVALSRSGAGIAGVIEDVVYAGDRRRIVVRTGDGTALLAALPNAGAGTGWAPGDRVIASWPVACATELTR